MADKIAQAKNRRGEGIFGAHRSQPYSPTASGHMDAGLAQKIKRQRRKPCARGAGFSPNVEIAGPRASYIMC